MPVDDELFVLTGNDENLSDSDLERVLQMNGLIATPQARSPNPSEHEINEEEPRQNPPHNATQSSFQRAFPGVRPAEISTFSRRVSRTVRVSLCEFWEEQVFQSLKTFNIPMETVFSPVCMSPTDEQVSMMAARSKCMELIRQDHPSLLSSPNRGMPLCFVARAGEGLPVHMQKALFFFTSVSNSIVDVAHFAAPTIATDVIHDKVESKIIRGMVSTGRGLAPDPMEVSDLFTDGGFISVGDILKERAQNRPESIREPVPALSMYIGFTGVVFKDFEGKEKREVFCVLTVTPADNFALMSYILNKFLLKPKMGSQKYEQLMELYLESSSFFKEIMRYECFCNLGADESEVGLPEDYWLEPGGRLGYSTVLSPFQIPLKIYNTIREDHAGADLGSIRIIGCPEMTFQRSDEYTKEWCEYMHRSINQDALRQETLQSGIDRYNASKEKSEFPRLNIGMAGGWPLDVDPEGNSVTVFGLPPLPLMHKFDANGARGNFSVFIANIGDADQALPDLTRAILTAFLVHSSNVNTRPEINHLLKDKRKANPLLVLRTYHGPDADPFSALVLANRQRMWLEALRSDIQVRRQKGASIQDILRISRDYLASVVKNLESMIECQVFRSATVVQMKAVIDLMPFEEICSHAPHSIANIFREKNQRLPGCRKHDTMHRSWNCFMKVWEDLNRFFSLNAGNLLCAVEVMLSQLMFKFAHTNETWTFFFVTVFVMAGNGHFQNQTPDGPVPCRIKPNTTGMDFLLGRIMDIWNALYEKLMIPPKDRHNLIRCCMRYTPTVWENLATAQAAAGKLIATPPPDANFQAISLTEIRDSLKSLIQYGPPRNEQIGQTVSYNSQEVNTTRVASTKRKLCNNNIVCMASNVGSKNTEQKEEGNTIDVVSAVLTSGSFAPEPKRRRVEFNGGESGGATARNQPLDGTAREEAVNMAYTATMAGTYVGLLNHIGAKQTEVNPAVSGYYSWGVYYIKKFCSSSMDTFVRDNFSRMKEGYKSRGIVMSIWLKMMHTLSLGKSKDEVIHHIWNDISVDALPMICVPMVFCNLLYRGLHMGSLVLSSVIASHLKCPVVSLKNLNAFFELDHPVDLANAEPGFKEDFLQIHEFVRLCFLNNRFCPSEDGPFCHLSNISPYISCDATSDLMPVNPKTSLLRVPPNKEKDEGHDISHKVALRIAAQYGEDLFGQCHMGPEVSTYRLGLVYLCERFAPDLRGMLSSKIFCSRKHLMVLGLESRAPGMVDYDNSAPLSYARQFNIRVRDQLQSQAIGVNIWSLLLITSLSGSTEIHPDISNCVAHSLVEVLLSNAPACSTPGGICPSPRFDHSSSSVKLYVPNRPNRPKHFLRPVEPSFVLNGTLPVAEAIGRFLPEDLLHASALSALPKILHCDLMEVPANAFTSPYALQPDIMYTFHIPYPSEAKYGTIRVDTQIARVCVETSAIGGSDQVDVASLDVADWEEQIRARGIVITPLIDRAGVAVVLVETDEETGAQRRQIGCLVPPPENEGLLLDASDCTYHALLTEELDVAKLFFLDVLKEYLLPVGEILYLNMDVLQEEEFRSQGSGGKVLYTRLNVPHVCIPETGKLYVTCLHQPRASHGRSNRSKTAITMAVNPWDVQLASAYTGDPASVVKHLR